MRQSIGGVVYDTEKAKPLCDVWDFFAFEGSNAKLYVTEKGRYSMAGRDSSGKHDRMVALSYTEARDRAELAGLSPVALTEAGFKLEEA